MYAPWKVRKWWNVRQSRCSRLVKQRKRECEREREKATTQRAGAQLQAPPQSLTNRGDTRFLDHKSGPLVRREIFNIFLYKQVVSGTRSGSRRWETINLNNNKRIALTCCCCAQRCCVSLRSLHAKYDHTQAA